MKEVLAPGLIQHLDSLSILWFEKSNQYVVTEKNLYKLIEVFLASENEMQFLETVVEQGYESKSANRFYTEINRFLEDCNILREEEEMVSIPFSKGHRQLTHFYKVDDRSIAVHFGSDALKNLIHTQLEHLEIREIETSVLCEFDIFSDEKCLVLFKDGQLLGSWKHTDYHLLQGKFAMHLLCSIHGNEESDWLGTFHASTVVKNNKAAMIIGDSGKGKSTFTALLYATGFEVLADDLTPILAKDTLVYPYPGGISIKAGSFDILKNNLVNFDDLPEHYINPYKGYVKYIGAPKSEGHLHGYPCKTMVCIHYTKGSETSLKPISISEALGTLIPESWLASNRYNAEQFLNWIKEVTFFELTYSKADEAIKVFSELFSE